MSTRQFLSAAFAAVLLPFVGNTSHAETVTGSGNLGTETRAVSGFHGVDLTGTGKLEVVFGDKEELIIEAEDNLLPHIESKVRADGVLEIGFKHSDVIKTTKTPTFKLTAKALDKLVMAGSGTIHVAGRMNAEHASVQLPGSGNITVDDLQTPALEARLEGSGKISLSGKTGSETVKLDGSGAFSCEGLQADTVNASISGSGACRVWAEIKLVADISGSGAIHYRGKPELIQRISGSGAVHAM